jgi:hypothetical protein
VVTGVVAVSTGRPASVSWVEYRSCRSKVRHDGRREAMDVAKKQMNRWGGGRVDAYHCRFCGGWHVGHPSRRH